MINFLRFLWHTMRRLRDGIVGSNHAGARRLVRSGRLTIGPHTTSYSVPRIKAFSHDNSKLVIGDYCSLSADSIVLIGGKHATDALTTYPHRILWNMEGAGEDGFPMPTGDGFIGSDVWLCDGAIVMPGLRIGHGAIVGAGAIVTKDVPDFAIVGGNPARVISYRFPEEQRQALLEIAWWDWSEDEVRKAVPLIAAKNVEDLIAYARAKKGTGSARPSDAGSGPAADGSTSPSPTG
jgi:chloramphenicol O-acetyltransferase type B